MKVLMLFLMGVSDIETHQSWCDSFSLIFIFLELF